ncbi:Beta-lactamase [Streptomyces davaonensis JCM 4913]|uniref:Beta-lactamase n=1 Tax=Streptomyces davaonensis (strain DSM 101723 / JCM 4913 / KCC S-0913 / 768) TaxID=1214101 RepID=K4RBG2_STRDJ|nr:class A beta-lactamase [Streptomyces davaonensis]CCK30169.1 Beta-lactamase [Streptomyces davaonensis JCM 4913]
MSFTPNRRTLLATATAALAAAATTPAGAADRTGATARLRALEEEHGGRLGVYAHNLATRRTVRHRADELFPMCSLFKTLAAAAVLRDLDRDGEVLNSRLHYTEADLVDPVPDVIREHLSDGMTVAALAELAITHSDNTAGNLLLRELGGPTAITRFARSLGDRVTRLDRWEPELNTAEPWRVTDTTSPAAIGRTYGRLVLGDALNRRDREQLTEWLLRNTTSTARFRAGLPPAWTLGDKTGSGSYGTANDVGVAWTETGAPIVLSVLTTKPEQNAAWDNALVAKTAKVLAETLS